MLVSCPICNARTTEYDVSLHLENGCPPSTSSQLLSSESQERDSPKRPRSPSPKKTKYALDESQKVPLAERVRPQSFDDFVGQEALLGHGGVLRQLLKSGNLPSMILWGPSGSGKTSFSRVIAHEYNARFVELSAPHASTMDVKKIIDTARSEWRLLRRKTVLFLDEIHRFNRSQQDSLLAAVENGDITLIGTTTENPSFKLNGALLSRARVFILEPLTPGDILKLVNNALEKLGRSLSDEVKGLISQASQGDGRVALTMLDTVLSLENPSIENTKSVLRSTTVYDQAGENHYNIISAMHKSIRGSDADAAMYYVARMLKGGEDPLYIARRLIRVASEDVGLADESCLPFAVAAYNACERIGMPECDVILAHCAVKLARASKSVQVYKAFNHVKADLEEDPLFASAPVPLHLRNAPTKLMSDIGYARGYKYNPDYDGPVDQEYFPEGYKRTWL